MSRDPGTLPEPIHPDPANPTENPRPGTIPRPILTACLRQIRKFHPSPPCLGSRPSILWGHRSRSLSAPDGKVDPFFAYAALRVRLDRRASKWTGSSGGSVASALRTWSDGSEGCCAGSTLFLADRRRRPVGAGGDVHMPFAAGISVLDRCRLTRDPLLVRRALSSSDSLLSGSEGLGKTSPTLVGPSAIMFDDLVVHIRHRQSPPPDVQDQPEPSRFRAHARIQCRTPNDAAEAASCAPTIQTGQQGVSIVL